MSALRRGLCIALLGVVFQRRCIRKRVVGPRVQFRQFFSLGQNGRVTIENQYGNVSIVAWDRDDVLVEAVKQTNDMRRMANDAHIVVVPADGIALDSHAIRRIEATTSGQGGISHQRPALDQPGRRQTGQWRINDQRHFRTRKSLVGQRQHHRPKTRRPGGTIDSQRPTGSRLQSRMPAQPIVLRSVNGPIHLLLPYGVKANLSARNVSGGIDTEFGRPSRVDGAQQLVVTAVEPKSGWTTSTAESRFTRPGAGILEPSCEWGGVKEVEGVEEVRRAGRA